MAQRKVNLEEIGRHLGILANDLSAILGNAQLTDKVVKLRFIGRGIKRNAGIPNGWNIQQMACAIAYCAKDGGTVCLVVHRQAVRTARTIFTEQGKPRFIFTKERSVEIDAKFPLVFDLIDRSAVGSEVRICKSVV